MTNNTATAELVRYNARTRGKLVTHLTWDQVSGVQEKFEEVLVEMPDFVVDFSLLEPFNREGVDLRIISDFEMLPNTLVADITFLRRPRIPLGAYFGDDSKAA